MKKAAKYTSAVAGLALVVTLGACSREDRSARTENTNANTNAPAAGANTTTKRAMVRFVNASPEGGPLDLWFGDQKAFASVGFKNATDYKEMPAERREFKLRFAGKDVGDPIATNSEGLSDGKHYTVIAMPKKGNKNDITLDALNDDTDNPPAGKAKVRVVNADKNIGEIDLVQAGKKDPVIGGINVDSSTRYKDIDPTNDLEIRRKDNKQIVTKVPEPVASGKNYTLIIMGGRNSNRPDVMRLEDGLVNTAANR